jgi:outer membrane protein assembly factor BamE (lipoprotein component of BamABCDE complex)
MSNDGMTKEIQMTKDENTEEPSRGIPLTAHRHSFVIFAATRLLLVFLIAFCVSCSGKRITRANVDQVSEGMSKKQVESILGPPTSINNQDFVIMKKTTYVYRQGTDTVTIVFKDDKVQEKDSTLAR